MHTLLLMLVHWRAYLDRLMREGFVYATRDGEPTLREVRETLDGIGRTFEEFKTKNDERMAEIEKRGAEDPVAREQVEKITEQLTELRSLKEDFEKLEKMAARPDPGEEKDTFTAEQIEHREKFVAYMRKPNSERLKGELEDIETRAVATTTDAAGGHAVPEIISRRIERLLPEISPLRNIVDVQQAGSKDFKLLVDARGMAYGWVGETGTRTETATPTLEQVAPTFGMIYAYPQATEESLDDMFFDVENWLVNSMVEAFAEGEENAILNGDGTNKPTGLLSGTPVATDDGARAFGVLQFVATGVAADWAATDPSDTFIDVIYKLKKGYRRNARWLMNKKTAGEIMKFKDGNGNYLWQPSALLGQPDRFIGYPVAESEEMPDKAANAFPVAFGDFSAGYILADLVGFRLTRDEITTVGYVKWYGRRRLGGNIKKDEGVKLIKIAI